MRRTDADRARESAATAAESTAPVDTLSSFLAALGLVAALVLALLLVAFVSVVPLNAQGWDTPRHMSPASQPSVALAWTRFPESDGGGEGAVGVWRPRGWQPWLGLRAGGVFNGANPRGVLGVDLAVPVATRGPWSLGWSTGLGVAVGELDTRATLPVQVGLSRTWSSGQVWASPYVAGGLAAEWNSDPVADDGEFRYHPVVELGADLSLDPGRTVVLRAGWSVVGRQGLSVGVGWNRR